MTKLHELTGDFIGLNELVESGKLSAQDVSDTMQGIQASIEEKANAIGFVISEMDGDLAKLDFGLSRIEAKKKALAANKERLIEYLRHNMEASGIKSIKCPFFGITHVDGQDIVTIVDESLLPDLYVNVKTTVTPDKALIKKALKDGFEVPGAKLDKGKSSIRIK